MNERGMNERGMEERRDILFSSLAQRLRVLVCTLRVYLYYDRISGIRLTDNVGSLKLLQKSFNLQLLYSLALHVIIVPSSLSLNSLAPNVSLHHSTAVQNSLQMSPQPSHDSLSLSLSLSLKTNSCHPKVWIQHRRHQPTGVRHQGLLSPLQRDAD
jgi:hypothetical protein